MHTPFIRASHAPDHASIIDLSLRAWSPVFRSFHAVWGSPLYDRFYPDWEQSQTDDVVAALDANPTWVVVAHNDVAGFVNVRFDDETLIGEIYMIAVDPDHQQQGLATFLTEHALAEMQSRGMTIATVSTGGDPGHAPARATYERNGFVAFPQVLYSKLLDPESPDKPEVVPNAAPMSAIGDLPPGSLSGTDDMTVQRIDYADIDPPTYASIRRVLEAAFEDADDENNEAERLENFSDFDHWFVAVEETEVVAVTGLLLREILVGGRTVTVAGIGGVATGSGHRNRGFASRLVDAALRFAHDQSVPFGLLQCTRDLVAFYAVRGWRQVPEPLACRQADGDTYRSPELPMIIELNSARWPPGPIDMNGLPW